MPVPPDVALLGVRENTPKILVRSNPGSLEFFGVGGNSGWLPVSANVECTPTVVGADRNSSTSITFPPKEKHGCGFYPQRSYRYRTRIRCVLHTLRADRAGNQAEPDGTPWKYS